MKLCVLTGKLDIDPLYSRKSLHMYYLSIKEYKKQILKGLASTYTDYNARLCFMYARDELKGRFIIGEEMISKSASYGCGYAKYVLKGRFELGENTISENGYLSFIYAKDILKNRFILGEEMIKNSFYMEDYEKSF